MMAKCDVTPNMGQCSLQLKIHDFRDFTQCLLVNWYGFSNLRRHVKTFKDERSYETT
jgi:hypothetical protein